MHQCNVTGAWLPDCSVGMSYKVSSHVMTHCGHMRADGTRLPMMVRLLLSIDRREDSHAAMETVHLAGELLQDGVVGVDLSGNPTVGSWTTWEPALMEARRLGLKLTIHAGEVAMLNSFRGH